MYDFDLFTIGGGSGGVRASRMAAQYGARVAVAEERYLGGTCVNVGCIPKKLLVYASEFSDTFTDCAEFGWTLGERSFDWGTLIANKNDEIARLNCVYEKVLTDNGVRILRARATIADEAGPRDRPSQAANWRSPRTRLFFSRSFRRARSLWAAVI